MKGRMCLSYAWSSLKNAFFHILPEFALIKSVLPENCTSCLSIWSYPFAPKCWKIRHTLLQTCIEQINFQTSALKCTNWFTACVGLFFDCLSFLLLRLSANSSGQIYLCLTSNKTIWVGSMPIRFVLMIIFFSLLLVCLFFKGMPLLLTHPNSQKSKLVFSLL